VREEARREGGPQQTLLERLTESMRLAVARVKAERERRCAICGAPIERGEESRWAAHRLGLVHVLCIPPLVRNLGEEQVRIWLRHGSEAFFPPLYSRN